MYCILYVFHTRIAWWVYWGRELCELFYLCKASWACWPGVSRVCTSFRWLMEWLRATWREIHQRCNVDDFPVNYPPHYLRHGWANVVSDGGERHTLMINKNQIAANSSCQSIDWLHVDAIFRLIVIMRRVVPFLHKYHQTAAICLEKCVSAFESSWLFQLRNRTFVVTVGPLEQKCDFTVKQRSCFHVSSVYVVQETTTPCVYCFIVSLALYGFNWDFKCSSCTGTLPQSLCKVTRK